MDAYHEMKSLVYIKAESDTLQSFWDFCTTGLYLLFKYFPRHRL